MSTPEEPPMDAMRAIDIIDEPHKWSREMTAWRASGSPYTYTHQPEVLTD